MAPLDGTLKTMEATITATRAVTAEFALRLIRPLLRTAIIAALVINGLGIYLTTVSAWWWILEVIFIGGTLLMGVLFLVARVFTRTVSPNITRAQKKATREYVDKLQRVSDSIATPKFVILFRIVRDIAQRRSDGFIASTTADSKTLHSDFIALQRLF